MNAVTAAVAAFFVWYMNEEKSSTRIDAASGRENCV